MSNPFDRLSIFWFSGTGNAARVCDWFAKEAKQNGTVTKTINLGAINRKLKPVIAKGSMLGFISPTHGFNYPPLMMNYILRFPSNPGGCKVFLCNTRGGLMLHRWFLPGLSGVALLFAALVLWIKGYAIVGMRSIDLPSNWISLHPGLRPKAIAKIYERCKHKTVRFAQKILTDGRAYRALYDLPIDIVLAPVAIAYYLVGRFFLAKTFVATLTCDNCGICYNTCPVNAIRLVNKRPFWTVNCESCMHCMNACPRRAIQTAHGFITGVIVLCNVVVMNVLLNQAANMGIVLPTRITEPGLIRFLILSAFYLVVMIASYRLVHFMQRFRWFDKMLEYTSLTRFLFWNRYQPEKMLRKK